MRDLAVALVGRDHHVGGAEVQPLEQHHQLPEEAALAELGLVELGVDVVMIEDVALAEELERPGDEEDQIGRVAALDRVESARCERSSRPAASRGTAPRHIPAGSPTRPWRRAAADGGRYAPRRSLVARLVALAGGADHRDLGARGRQRPAFVPDPPVEGQRQVFDDDQHLAALQAAALRGPRPCRGRRRSSASASVVMSARLRCCVTLPDRSLGSAKVERPLIVALVAMTGHSRRLSARCLVDQQSARAAAAG